MCARCRRALRFSRRVLIAIVAAVSFATTNASNYVADLVLSNVGPYNMRFGFVYGTFAMFAITAALLAWRPNRLPFALKAIALFLVVRAVFVSLTHIAPSPIDPQKPAPFLNAMFYGSDQFFSGHTGMPFLGALCFWHMPQWRFFYLAATRVLRRGRAARALPLFDRRAGGAVHHPRHFPDRVLDVPTGLCAVPVVRARRGQKAEARNPEEDRQVGRSPQEEADAGAAGNARAASRRSSYRPSATRRHLRRLTCHNRLSLGRNFRRNPPVADAAGLAEKTQWSGVCRLLRTRRERPSRRGAADERDELAAPHMSNDQRRAADVAGGEPDRAGRLPAQCPPSLRVLGCDPSFGGATLSEYELRLLVCLLKRLHELVSCQHLIPRAAPSTITNDK